MAEITKRETRNRGERRPVVAAASPPPRATAPAPSKSNKRKAQSPPRPQEPLQSRDPPGLPSSREKQDLDLPAAQWKSISESGVLTASLKLSMEKWRNGGCFEKYWVKNPVKKAHRDFQNPPATSMSRLGSAWMIIEPHSFEVALYSVKPAGNPVPVAKPAKPLPSVTQPIPPYKPPVKNDPSLPPANSTSTPSNASVSAAAAGSTVTKVESKPPAPVSQATNVQHNPASSKTIKDQGVKSAQGDKSGTKQGGQPPPDPPSNNPVIRELANRASRDQALKDLMKIVAQGSATEAQVKAFQVHIDDINAMLNAKNRPKSNKPVQTTSNASTRPIQPMTWTQPITSNTKQEAVPINKLTSHTQPKAISSMKSDISAVVFEILSGTGDRYLIPRKSLLEFTEGTRLAVLSFLVHLKGTSASGGFYEDDKEYCELITLKFLADRQGILDSLRRAVDSPDVVRAHMENWAAKMSIAEKAYLMLRLRMISEGDEIRPQTAVSIVTEEVPKSEYEAPNSLFPLQRHTLVGKG